MRILPVSTTLLCAAVFLTFHPVRAQPTPQEQPAMTVTQAREALWNGFWAWRRDGDADGAIRLCQQVLAAFPQGFTASWPENLHELLASCDEAAIRAARQRQGGFYTLSVPAELAALYLQAKHDPARAAEYAERALRLNPDADRMMTILLRARQMLAQTGATALPAVFANGHYFCGAVAASPDGDTTLACLEHAGKELGVALTSAEAGESACATLAERCITFTLGSDVAVADGRQITLRVAPYLDAQGRMMVPLRPLVEALGGTVKWEPEAQIVYVTLPQPGGAEEAGPPSQM